MSNALTVGGNSYNKHDFFNCGTNFQSEEGNEDSHAGKEKANNEQKNLLKKSEMSELCALNRSSQSAERAPLLQALSRNKREIKGAETILRCQNGNDYSLLHFRSIKSFIHSVLEKSKLGDDGQWLQNLFSALEGIGCVQDLLTAPDIDNIFDLFSVLENHLYSGIHYNEIINLALKKPYADIELLTDQKKFRLFSIAAMVYYFRQFYKNHDLKDKPTLQGTRREILSKWNTDFFIALQSQIQKETQKWEFIQLLRHRGKILENKGKDKDGKNIFTKVAYGNLAFSNAVGKTVKDLANDRDICDLPNLGKCTSEEIERVIKAAFRELHQDSEYPIGTLEHSLASTVILYSDIQGREVPKDLGNKKKLMAEFNRIIQEHKKSAASGNIRGEANTKYDLRGYAPMDYAAMHLFHAMGVENVLKEEIIDEKAPKANTEEERQQAKKNISFKELLTKFRTDFVQSIEAEYGFGLESRPTREEFVVRMLRQSGWSDEKIRGDATIVEDIIANIDADEQRNSPAPRIAVHGLNPFSMFSNSYKPSVKRIIKFNGRSARDAFNIEEKRYNDELPGRASRIVQWQLLKEGRRRTKENVEEGVTQYVKNHRVKTEDELESERRGVEIRQLLEGFFVPGLNYLDQSIVDFQEGRNSEGIKNLFFSAAGLGLSIASGKMAFRGIGALERAIGEVAGGKIVGKIVGEVGDRMGGYLGGYAGGYMGGYAGGVMGGNIGEMIGGNKGKRIGGIIGGIMGGIAGGVGGGKISGKIGGAVEQIMFRRMQRAQIAMAANILHSFDEPMGELIHSPKMEKTLNSLNKGSDSSEEPIEERNTQDHQEAINSNEDITIDNSRVEKLQNSITKRFREMPIGETGEYVHPLTNEKCIIAWVRFPEKDRLELCLLKRKLGSKDYVRLDWETGRPISDLETIYQQEKGSPYLAAKLRGGAPPKNPKAVGNKKETSEEPVGRSNQKGTGGPTPLDDQTAQEAREAFKQGEDILEMVREAMEKNKEIGLVSREEYQEYIQSLEKHHQYRKDMTEIGLMKEEELNQKLKSYERDINKLVPKKKGALDEKTKKAIDDIFQKKTELISKWFEIRLGSICYSLKSYQRRANSYINYFDWLSKDKNNFNEAATGNVGVIQEEPLLEEQIIQSKNDILKLEQTGRNHGVDYEQSLDQIISSLYNKAISLNQESKYFEALSTVEESTPYIEKLAELWKKAFAKSREEAPSSVNLGNDPYMAYKILYENVYSGKRNTAYIEKFLKQNLEEADQFRKTVKPYDEQGDSDANINSKYRKNLIDELKASPFKGFLVDYLFLAKDINRERMSDLEIESQLKNIRAHTTIETLNNTQDFLSDISRYDGDFHSMAKKLIQATGEEASTSTATTDDIIGDLVQFQKLIKQLTSAYSENKVEVQKIILSALCSKNHRIGFVRALEYGVKGYLNLIEKVAHIRNPLNAPLYKTPSSLLDSIKENVAQHLPEGRTLGPPRMEMHINKQAFGPLLERDNMIINYANSDAAYLKIIINQELLNSEGFQARLTELQKYENKIEEHAEADASDELLDSAEGEQRLIKPYEDKPGIKTKKEPQQKISLQKKQGIQPPTAPSTSSKSSKFIIASPEITKKIRSFTSRYFWNELNKGENTHYGIPEIEFETAMTGKSLFLDLGRLRHILRRHYHSTFDKAFSTDEEQIGLRQPLIFDRSIPISQLIPTFRKIVRAIDSQQLKDHYSKINPNSVNDVYSIINAQYGGKNYRIVLYNDTIKTIFPN